MNKQGYIYFMVDCTKEQVKIGWSTNPEDRLKHLLTGYPGKLVIAKLINGSQKEERKYHRLFCHYKIEREWFILSEEIKEFLNRKQEY